MYKTHQKIAEKKAQLRAEFTKSEEGKRIIRRHYSYLLNQADNGHSSQDRLVASEILAHVKVIYRDVLQ